MSGEITARGNADTSIVTRVSTTEAAISAILNAATASADTFVEIVSLINAVDTTNDTAFASFVLRTDASVDSLETALSSEITATNNYVSSVNTRVAAAEATIASIDTNYVNDNDFVTEAILGFDYPVALAFDLTLAYQPSSTDNCYLFINGIRHSEPTTIVGTLVTFPALAYELDTQDKLIVSYVKA